MTINLNELNTKYYALWADLYRNRAQLTDKQYSIMSHALYKEYLYELDRYIMERDVAEGQELFRLRLKKAHYVPRRGFLWRWNKTAKMLKKIFNKEFSLFLADIELSCNLIKKDIADTEAESKAVQDKLAESNTAVVSVTTTVAPKPEDIHD